MFRDIELIPYDAEAWERWVLSLRPKPEAGSVWVRRTEGGLEYSYVVLPDGTLWKTPPQSWTSSRQWKYEWSAP